MWQKVTSLAQIRLAEERKAPERSEPVLGPELAKVVAGGQARSSTVDPPARSSEEEEYRKRWREAVQQWLVAVAEVAVAAAGEGQRGPRQL